MKQIESLKEIQTIGLGILKFIDKICTENKIKYFLCAGTALGAVRHKGFIPWDDDVDVMMPREDYERFLKLMDKSNNEHYKCLHFGKDFPYYFYRFAKVVDLNTSLTEINFPKHPDMGIYVDIFPIDGIDEKVGKKIIKKHYNLGLIHYQSASLKFVKSKRGFVHNVFKYIAYVYAKIFGWQHWVKKSEKLIKKYKMQNCKFAGIYDEYQEKEIMPKEIFDEVIYVDFEDSKFPIVKNYDYYLTKIYGDYMTPPPENQRIQHHVIAYKK